MMKIKLFLLTNFLVLGLVTSAQAQILDMPNAEPAAEETMPQPEPMPENADGSSESAPEPAQPQTFSKTLPGRGMSMDQVESAFGSPNEKIERVGEPPITRWVYGNFTVYFEEDKVIHAVTHKN